MGYQVYLRLDSSDIIAYIKALDGNEMRTNSSDNPRGVKCSLINLLILTKWLFRVMNVNVLLFPRITRGHTHLFIRFQLKTE